ncbi:uncharacterized protein THITE_2112124 [Thermothielavioides terrestris NRRL 8126]|uniref:Uncharacterized protein n=1 Tax=Thermothielavioides terrestris (strain ATCC 38088 / NRRL 8126) TaxID=578455 RepID=G2R4Z9_THETT|nr:uncharacterized protein THITE_2112124 [Thermothielavioides terrestris NRRL 8126]AEO65276.1 hypothetical protein THITE_2112124 [Thermothielavioides terrestris NRRL 8126]
MWSMKRSRANGHVEISEHTEIRRKPMPSSNQQVANFSYPRTDFVHLYRRDDPVVRDSLGSESSPPPMVEDHGSDLSAEDDCQYRVAGSELWDSWPAREHKGKKIDYPAFIKSPTDVRDDRSHREPAKSQRTPPTTRGPALSSGSQSSQVLSRPADVQGPEPQPSAPKPPPKVTYSLFPPAEIHPKHAPVPLQPPSGTRSMGLEPSPRSLPSTQKMRNAAADGKGRVTSAYRPGSSRATTPISVHGSSITAGSSLLLRSPGPTPPASPSDVRGSSEVPNYPSARAEKSSTSNSNQRNFSLSKITTRSSPSLANLAKAHHQASKTGHHHKPVTPADLYDRPLPPLPTERPETPPQVSVFETDTDDEADEDDGRPTSEAKKFARRLMHGLVHHHLHHHHDNEKRDKGTAPDHKRSISDDGPSGSKEGGGGGRMGISRTFNAAARYRHSGGTADAAGPPRAAVSMDLPRDSGHRQYQQMADEGEKGGRFWSGRASNELLGRIWKRRC